jgi:hypothetical protein
VRTRDENSLWITGKPEMVTRGKGRVSDHPLGIDSELAAQSKRESILEDFKDDAVLGPHGNENHERMAEMTIPLRRRSNKSEVEVRATTDSPFRCSACEFDELQIGIDSQVGCWGEPPVDLVMAPGA